MPRRLPAEWEQQSAVQITWPHADSYWRDILAWAEQSFVQMAKAITHSELLIIVCLNPMHQTDIQNQLILAGVDQTRIRWCFAHTNDSWARDHGAITVLENNLPVVIDFEFNAWGNKYHMPLDNRITQQLIEQPFMRGTYQQASLVLEGGSIESDGAGTLMSTAKCLLDPARNNWSECNVKPMMEKYFGAQRAIVLQHGELIGDDTDAHIDTLARFVNARTIVYQGPGNLHDSQSDSLYALEQELSELKTLDGLPYELIALPLPPPIFGRLDERRLPASYANFLIINDAVLVPVFGVATDNQALHILQQCFLGRTIVPIDSRALIENFGSVHCLTMQFPQGVVV